MLDIAMLLDYLSPNLVGLLVFALWAIMFYVVVIAILVLLPYPLQPMLIYLHWVNFPFGINFAKGGQKLGFRGITHSHCRIWYLKSSSDSITIADSVRSLFISTKDGATLGAWHILPRKLIPRPQPGMKSRQLTSEQCDSHLKSADHVFLYFHGNAGNRATFHRTNFYKILTSFGKNCHVLAIDYRGFGDSSSAVPTETTLRIDAMAAFEWLLSKGVTRNKIILVGHSLGTGVATDLAYNISLSSDKSDSSSLFGGLILLSGYSTIGDAALGYPMVPLLMPFRGWSTSLEVMAKGVISEKLASAKKISFVRRPILLIHGSRDFEIRPWQSRALFLEAASGRIGKKLIDPDSGSYWALRRTFVKFDPLDVPEISFTSLPGNEGSLWSLNHPVKRQEVTHLPNVDRVWLLEVTHGGHNTLSKFHVVSDTIESFMEAL